MISIIIPVYNKETCLRRCVDSVLNQTYRELEIILVDDGSTDNSGIICDDYADLDRRVKVIHKKNGGVSSARNVGLKNVSGEFIGFIDSDDFINENMYETLYEAIINSNSNVVMCNYNKIIDENVIHVDNFFDKNIVSGSEFLESVFRIKNMGVLWNKLFRRDMFFCNGISLLFDESISLCEDVLLLTKMLKKEKNIYLCRDYLYNYVFNNDSLCHSKVSEKNLTILKALEICIEECEKTNKELVNSAYYMYMINNTRCYLKLKNDKSLNFRFGYIKQIKKNLKKCLKIMNFKNKLKIYAALLFPKFYYNYKLKHNNL